ncbi:MAG: LicD family protein [Veillonella atypica]|uniref:LicD family protein n=1 Tax=Veillonella atypica TaxID=39777 RepID=UPI0039967015
MGKKRLTTKEFHDVLLKTLLHFDKFCRERDIVYSLAYGTLLGAIRHKGFIPWDDDIDICMDRENYDKFEKDWKEHITNCDNENYQLWPEMDENSFFASICGKIF